MNGDRVIDVVSGFRDGDEENSCVWLNRGNGTLIAPLIIRMGAGPCGEAIGDVNRDGNLDLLTANCNSPTIGVLLGKGDGTFGRKALFAAGSRPIAPVVGNFNEDDAIDLAVIDYNGPKVIVLENTGKGIYVVARSYDIPHSENYALATADVNADGKLDLVATGDAGYLTVFLGTGDGGFKPTRTNLIVGGVLKLHLADFSGDGVVDAALGGFFNHVDVLLGNGDGTFHAGASYDAGDGIIISLAVSDLDGDGDSDVATGSEGTVAILLNNGDGTFEPFSKYAVQEDTIALTTADMNGDTIQDVVTAGAGSSVLLGNGDGTFRPQLAYATGSVLFDVVAGDYNNDGYPDIVSPIYSLSMVTVTLNDGIWGAPTPNSPKGGAGVSASSFAASGRASLGCYSRSTPPPSARIDRLHDQPPYEAPSRKGQPIKAIWDSLVTRTNPVRNSLDAIGVAWWDVL